MKSQMEDLKELLSSDKDYLSLGQIQRVSLARDRSVLNADVSIWPEDREITARVLWESVGMDAGFYHFPNPGDLVLVAFAEASVNNAYVIKRFSSTEDKVPVNAMEGDMVIKTRKNEKLWLTGTERINLSKGDAEPTENIVLGQVFKTWATTLLEKLLECMSTLEEETHVGSMPGHLTSPPTQKAMYTAVKNALNEIKNSPIDDNGILSMVSFTEKGNDQ